jgi:hypothetical protein
MRTAGRPDAEEDEDVGGVTTTRLFFSSDWAADEGEPQAATDVRPEGGDTPAMATRRWFCRSMVARSSGSLSSVNCTPRLTSPAMASERENSLKTGGAGELALPLALPRRLAVLQDTELCTIARASSSLTSLLAGAA